MLTIRPQQIAILERDLLCRWIVRYLRDAYPGKAGEMGPAQLDMLVRESLDDARSSRFRDPAAIRKYVHVAFLLGRDFASRPEMDWARRILDSPRYKHERVRLRALEDATAKYLDGNRAGTLQH